MSECIEKEESPVLMPLPTDEPSPLPAPTSASEAEEKPKPKHKNDALQREKARERKRNHRLREPESNKLNDLRARVRRVCRKQLGRIDNEWVIKECERRIQKWKNKPARHSSDASSTNGSFNRDMCHSGQVNHGYEQAQYHSDFFTYSQGPSFSQCSPLYDPSLTRSSGTPHDDMYDNPRDVEAAYSLLQLGRFPACDMYAVAYFPGKTYKYSH